MSNTPRQMTGLWATLSTEQQAMAASYTGPEVFGPDEVAFTILATARMYEELDEQLSDTSRSRPSSDSPSSIDGVE